VGRQTTFWPDLAAGSEEEGDRRETKMKVAMAAMGQLSRVM